LSAAQLDGRWMVRVSIGVETTTRDHVARLWELLQEAVLQTPRSDQPA
jgi:aromatic-L-amino-acid decarboxylase